MKKPDPLISTQMLSNGYLLLLPFGAAIVYASSILDPTFLSRLMLAFGGIVLVSGALWWSRSLIYLPVFHPVLGVFLLYWLWQVQSVFWVPTFSEAVLESQRVLLSFAVFVLTLIFLKNVANFEQRLLQVALVLSTIALVASAYQLFQIDQIDKLSLYSVKGIAGHRNLSAAFLLLMLGFLGIGYVRWKGWLKKWAAVNGFLIVLLLVILQARSAWVALIMAAVFALILQWIQGKSKASFRQLFRWTWMPLAVVLLGFAWYAWKGGGDQFIQRLNVAHYTQSETAIERLRLWNKTWCTFTKHPLTGVGAGNWQSHYADCNLYGLYSVELNDLTYQRPHNDFLWVLAESGLLGCALYLFLWVGIFYLGIHVWKSAPQNQSVERLIRVSLLVGLILVANFSFPKERVELLIWTYTLLAWIYYDWTQSRAKSHFAFGANGWVLLLLVVTGLFSLFTISKRIDGEYDMKQVYQLKSAKQWKELIAVSDLAYSPYYTVDPNSIPIHWYRGSAHFSLGQFAEARKDFEKALTIAPFSQHCWNDLGSCMEKLGERSSARDCYMESLRISPLFDDPKLNLAILSYKDQDYSKALFWLDHLQDSLRTQPYRAVIETERQQLLE